MFTNTTGLSLTGLTVSYNVEKYRNGSNSAGFSIQMYYSTDGSTWTSAGSNFLTSFAADADNNGYASAPGATVAVSNQTLTFPSAIANNGVFYLAWNYSVTSGTTTSNAQGLGVDDVSVTAITGAVDTAPSVTTTSPASGATAATNASIVVTFSENVTLDSGWYGISCTSSGSHTAAQSGGPLTFTLVPSPVFTAGETCTVTVYASKVHDQDANDPPDIMASDKVWSFAVDAAPYVLSTYPANAANGIPRSANLTVTFSEAANVTTGWFAISCGTSGSHTAAVTGGPTTFTLNPDADFTAGESCTATVYGANVTDQDTYDPPDGMIGNYTWTFSVSSAVDCAPDLFFSEYVEGSSNNKAVEIVNATAGSVNLANYDVQIYANGSSTAGSPITLVGTLAQGGVYVLCNSSASFTGQCNQTSGSLNFNGNDAVVLRHSSSIIDAIGQIGYDPGAAWAWGGLTTLDMTLRRKASVTSGDSAASDGFLAGLASQWDGYAKDAFDGLGAHSCSCAEVAPYVIGTLPDTNGAQAAVGANLTVTFQEPVSASASSFSLQCDKSGAHALSVSGGPASFTLDPTADFQSCETCTLTVLKDYVTDLDTSDPPNNMVDNYAFSFTTACACTSIPVIQGTTDSSPCINQTISTLSGCVTGVTATGFYMPDVTGDGNSATSDGIYVYMYAAWANGQGIAAGYTATAVNGDVQEFYNATELYNPSSVSKGTACTLPTPVPATQIQTLGAANMDQYESVEFMRVSMDIDGYVQGPTKRFVSRFTHGDPEIGFIKWGNESSVPNPPRLFEEDYAGYGGLNYLTGACNKDLPDVDFGDRIQGTGIIGVMGYHFDKWQLIVDETLSQSLTVTNTPDVTDSETAFTANQWGVCTYNVENMFDYIDDGDGDIGDWQPPDDATYQAMLQKRARGIAEDLKGCSVVGVEEMEGKDAVWAALVGYINSYAAAGQSFAYDYYESMDERDITVGIIYDANKVTLNSSTQRQGCTTTNYSVSYTNAQGSRVIANPCTGGAYPLYDRPPYVANLTVTGVTGGPTFTMIVNHFKSMSGGADTTRIRREAQAAHNVTLINAYSATTPNIAMVGDLNDYIGSTPIAILNAGTTYDGQALVNVHTAHIPKADQYTYNFSGESEVLDYVFLSEAFDSNYFLAASPMHINSDFPDVEPLDNDNCAGGVCALGVNGVLDLTSRHASDHDPVLVRFDRYPTAVTLTGLAATSQGDAIEIAWDTVNETDHLGFNLYRDTSEAGPGVKLNAGLIPSQGPGSPLGHHYSYLDAADLVPGTTYTYWLEDVSTTGVATRHGPISVVYAGGPNAVGLVAFGYHNESTGLIESIALVAQVTLVMMAAWAVVRRRRARTL